MEVLLVLIPASLAISSFFLLAFIWAVKGGQFDDLKKPAHTLLYDESLATKPTQSGKIKRHALKYEE